MNWELYLRALSSSCVLVIPVPCLTHILIPLSVPSCRQAPEGAGDPLVPGVVSSEHWEAQGGGLRMLDTARFGGERAKAWAWVLAGPQTYVIFEKWAVISEPQLWFCKTRELKQASGFQIVGSHPLANHISLGQSQPIK